MNTLRQAVANYANVMDTDAVLNPVLDQFGKIDILINNAGGLLKIYAFLGRTANQYARKS